MEVKEISIKEITPYANNAKLHPEHQIEQIATSLKMFGFQQPMVISKDGTIVIGHGRFEAAKKLGMETVPCVIAEDLTDDELRMLRLADNKLNESDWDLGVLAEELEGLDFGELDLDWGLEQEDEDEDTKYTDKTDIPQYTPSPERVETDSLVDPTKTAELLEEIDAADISEDEKQFLRMAACRHLRFNYRLIADYYAQATEEMQTLMEKSALVLLDIDDAIKNGYAKFSTDIRKCV